MTDRFCSRCGGVLQFVAVEANNDASYRCSECGDEWFGSTIDNWPWKLREVAAWFDTVDELLSLITVEDKATGDVQRLVERLGGPSTEIQEDLRRLADWLETA